MPGPKAYIHIDEIAANPFEAQEHRMSNRIRTVPERYRFLINEQNGVLFIKDDEPTTYEEYLNIS